jgi:acyl-CoA reductase-like NAD-dependent aldehyde dehydrogenase
MTTITKLKAALDLMDAQWKCTRPWSMEEAQDVAECLRSVIVEMEAEKSELEQIEHNTKETRWTPK